MKMITLPGWVFGLMLGVLILLFIFAIARFIVWRIDESTRRDAFERDVLRLKDNADFWEKAVIDLSVRVAQLEADSERKGEE